MKYCGILKTETDFRIHSISITTKGLPIAYQPFFVLGINEKPDIVVNAIKKALASNTKGIHSPSNFKEINDNYLQGVGFKSLKELHKKSIYCNVELDGSHIVFYPTKKETKKMGFMQLDDNSPEVVPFDGPPLKIIEALERAFNKCQ